MKHDSKEIKCYLNKICDRESKLKEKKGKFHFQDTFSVNSLSLNNDRTVFAFHTYFFNVFSL